MENIKIRVATEADCDAIIDFMSKYFYPEEPLTLAHPTPGLQSKEDEEYTVSSQLKHGTCLVAYEEGSGKLVGATIAGPIERGSVEEMLASAELAAEKWKDISLLLAYIDKKSDLFNRFNIDKSLHGYATAIHPDYRGQGISEKVFAFLLEIAKKMNFPMISNDCTSIYSIKIAERCGLTHVSTVTYDEYNASIGRELFKPIAPNFEIKTFVKDLRK